MHWFAFRTWLAIFLLLAASRGASAEIPASPILDEAHRLLLDLRKNDAFIKSYRRDALIARCTILRYRTQPPAALDEARAIEEPFDASLALAAIAAQNLKDDPNAAERLYLEALGRAAKITHWTGTDATSFPYIFQLIPQFPADRSRALLAASRDILKIGEGDRQIKSKSVHALAKITLEVDPSLAESLLDSTRSNQYSRATRLLGRTLAAKDKADVAKKAADFYASGKDWPSPETPLGAALAADALSDLPAALQRIAASNRLSK